MPGFAPTASSHIWRHSELFKKITLTSALMGVYTIRMEKKVKIDYQRYGKKDWGNEGRTEHMEKIDM